MKIIKKLPLIGILFILMIGTSSPSYCGDEDLYRQAVHEYRNESYVSALKKFRLLADKGHAQSQLKVGYMYQKGWGVKKDISKAVFWYRKAANQGNRVALNNLGWAYLFGKSVQKDYKRAFDLFTKSADLGYHRAQANLARMYTKGVGVKINYKKAIELNEKAAKQGNKAGMNNLAWILSTCPDDTLRDGKRALKIMKDLLLRNKRSPMLLDTLAAVYAELGMFKKAIETQKEAISIMHHIKSKKIRDQYWVRIALYKQGKLWRDKPKGQFKPSPAK